MRSWIAGDRKTQNFSLCIELQWVATLIGTALTFVPMSPAIGQSSQSGNLVQNSSVSPLADASGGLKYPISFPSWQTIWSDEQTATIQKLGVTTMFPARYYLSGGWGQGFPPSGRNVGIQFEVFETYSTPAWGEPGIYQRIDNLVPGAEYQLTYWANALCGNAQEFVYYPYWGVSLGSTPGAPPQFYGSGVAPTTAAWGRINLAPWVQQTMSLVAPSSTAYLNFRAYMYNQPRGSSDNLALADVVLRQISLCGSDGNFSNTSPALSGDSVFYSYANFDYCRGRLTATALANDGTPASVPRWDAACNLTAGSSAYDLACSTSSVHPTSTMVSGVDASGGTGFVRNLLSYWPELMINANGYRTGNLGTGPATSSASDYSNSTQNQYLVNYLRGSRAQENTAIFRTRVSVLGDIVDSSPIVVNPPNGKLDALLQDALNSTDLRPRAAAYASFKANYADRPIAVYVGANDGFMHAFRASSPNDGSELFGYMPSAAFHTMLNNLHHTKGGDIVLDYSSPRYAHNYYLDATPASGDAYVGNQWRTLLAFGAGAGSAFNARSLSEPAAVADTDVVHGTFSILDISRPELINENSMHFLIREWGLDNPPLCTQLDTVDPAHRRIPCHNKLGAVVGTASIVQLHNGHSGVIFGNGFYSENSAAGVFVYDLQDDALYYLSAPDPTPTSPTASAPNGIAYASPADLDGDGITDYIYAGDLLGHVWRFDITDSIATNWGAAALVYQTPNSAPITTSVQINSVDSHIGNATVKRQMVSFGTGRAWPVAAASGPTYASGNHALYSVWDWNLAHWNMRSNVHFDSLPALPANTTLLQQTVVSTPYINGIQYRVLSNNPICWVDGVSASGCTTFNAYGWTLPLPIGGEQVVSNPTIINGILVVNTIIPYSKTGFTMTIEMGTGQSPKTFFANTDAGSNIGGAQLEGIGTPAFRLRNGVGLMYQKTILRQQPTTTSINMPVPQIVVKRLTWRELR